MQISPQLHLRKLERAPASPGPFQGLHTFRWFSHAVPLLLSVRTHEIPRHWAHPVSQNCKSQAAKVSLCICWNCLPKSTNCQSVWSVCHELRRVGGPLRMSLLGHRLLMLHFLLHNGACCQAGTHSLIMFIIVVTYSLAVRDAGFFRATGFLL